MRVPPKPKSGLKAIRAWQQEMMRLRKYQPEAFLLDACEDMGLDHQEAERLWKSGIWEFCVRIAKGEAQILDLNLLREALGIPRVPVPVEIQDRLVVDVDYSLPYDKLLDATPHMSWDFCGTPKLGRGRCDRYLQNGIKRRTILAAIPTQQYVTKQDVDEALAAHGLRHALVHEAHAFYKKRVAAQFGLNTVAWGTSWFFDFMGDRACGEDEYVPVFWHSCPSGGSITVSMRLDKPDREWDTQMYHFLAAQISED